MRWPLLARTEFELLVRSRGLWLTFPVVFLTGFLGGIQPEVVEVVGTTAVVAEYQVPVLVFGGLAALLVSYRAVSYERQSGRVLLVGALPFARHDLVVGKAVGRTAAVSVPVVLAVVAGALVVGLVEGQVASPVVLLGFLAFAVCYLAATVGLGVGLSTLSPSSTPAVAGVVVHYVVLTLGWVDLFSTSLYTALTGNPVVPTYPPADVKLFLLQRVTPAGAFSVLTNWLFGVGNSSTTYNNVVLQSLPRTHTNALVVGNAFGTDVPAVLAEPFALVVLAVWFAVPVVAGVLLFERVDLP